MSSSSSSRSDHPSSTTGHCACGRTRYTLSLADVQSDLRLSAYCHCTRCQRLNGAPFIWTTHWAERAVSWSSAEPSGGCSSSNGSGSSGAQGTKTNGGARLIPLTPATSSSNDDDDNKKNNNNNDKINHAPTSSTIPTPTFAPTMALYEAVEGRKWKQRCDHCGTPLGSWNEIKRQWSLWPSTLTRSHPPPSPSDPEGGLDPSILRAIAADHHQFYGGWRMMSVRDGLEKWQGYRTEDGRGKVDEE